jgi:rRNA-processing protein EBP2
LLKKKHTNNKHPNFPLFLLTADHMAKVKDRLIFETKKIAAFEQRKANKEQKVLAKEVRQHKTLEKNKRKKQHLEQVNEWAKVAAQNRGNNNDDIIEKQFLNRMSNNSSSKSPVAKSAKRIAMDKKYGFGGKRGRFKQMDKKTINDMSSFNPRGNFAGGGMKKKNTGNKKNQGANRPGKNKRMAARQRKQS